MTISENSPAVEKRQAQLYMHKKQFKEAELLLSRLCDKYETDAEIRCMRATVFGLLGSNEEAERMARAALHLDGELPEAWSLLGAALMAQENYLAALDAFQNVVGRNSEDVHAHYNMGKILSHQGRYTEAVPHYQQAITLQPGYPELHLDLGISCYHAGDASQAVTVFSDATILFPRNSALHYWHAQSLQVLGENEQAMLSYEKTIELQPDMSNAHAWLASLRQQAGNVAAAFAHYEKALYLNPDSAEIHYNHATLLQAEDRYVEAETAYRRALELNVELQEAWNNLGLTLQELGRLDEARHCFDHVTGMSLADDGQVNKIIAEVHWHKALLLLLMGDFERGWPEYEWRWADPTAVANSSSLPPWDGSPLSDKTILIKAEQGVGDEIMFASCIPDLVKKAGHVMLECEPRLVPLFSRSFPEVTVCSASQTVDTLQAGVQIATGSLPMYLRASPGDFHGAGSYLSVDAEVLGKWKGRYKTLGEGLNVGISWRGGRVSQSRKRSTSLNLWEGLFRLESVNFINLQYGDCVTELEQVHRDYGVRVHDWDDADPLSDLDDFAAQVAALDLVISVDNATVHIAGALGIPVWILQPFAPEWRWLAEGEDSYWYPSVRQIRQPAPGDWSPVFVQVKAELELLLAQ